ncbi:MAG: carbohydrate kinase, partial [Bacteroidota bacterium]
EGIAFSFVHGVNILKNMGLNVSIMRVGNDNLFQSEVFSGTVSNLLGCKIEVVETTGAVGAAKAAGVAAGVYVSLEEAVRNVKVLTTYTPQNVNGVYEEAYQAWEGELAKIF